MKLIMRIALSLLLVVPVSADNITMVSEEWAPFNFTADGKRQGVSMDTLALMLKKMGSSKTLADVEIYPWSRGYNMIKSQDNIMLFAMTRTEEREPLFKWVCAIARNETHVWATKDSPIKDLSEADLPKYSYGTVAEDASEQMIIAKGVPRSKLERTNSYLNNAKKLRAGRIDLLVDNIKGIKEIAKKLGISPDEFRSVYRIAKLDICYAFSKNVSDDIIMKYQKALDEVKKEGALKKIQDKYLN